MNMNFNPIENNFEEPEFIKVPPPRDMLPGEIRDIIQTPGDIRAQLYLTEVKHAAAIAKMKAGDKTEEGFLKEQESTLKQYRTMFDVKFGKLTKDNEEIYEKIKTRLAQIQEVLNTSATLQ